MQVNTIPSNPFVGLRPFESTESLFFFGRGAQTGELMERLYTCRFVSVVGRSGCGKSSLIRAGLIPKLRAGFLVADRDSWVVETMKPGDRPLRSLAAAVLRVTGGGAKHGAADASAAEVEALAEEISAEGVEAVTKRLAPVLERGDANFLLLVDQFEEIFRFGSRSRKDDEDEDDAATARSRDEAADFVSIMLALSEQRDVPAYVVMTMRSDFLGDCDAFRGLPEAMNHSQYLVPRLSTKEREEAISGPIRLYGQAIAPRLLDLVRNDVGDKLDQLPVMQHAMMRTWENWGAREDGPVDVPDYEAAGTIRSALSDDAEAVLAAMGGPDSERGRLTARVFQALTDTDAENRRIRRPAHLRRLEAVTGAGRDEIMEIVSLFEGGGRSFLAVTRDEARGNHLIDISHESLIRQWKTLRDWVDKEAEDRSLYVRISDAAMRRKESEGRRGGLWDDPELQQALDWWRERDPTPAWAAQYHRKSKKVKKPSAADAAEHDDDAYDEEDLSIHTESRNFLAESRRVRDHERRRNKTFKLLLLALAFIMVTTIPTFGYYISAAQRATALAQRDAFKRQAEIEEKGRLEAQAAESKAKAAGSLAEQLRELAEEAKDYALKQKGIAEDNAKRADDATRKAVAEAAHAVAAEKSARAAEETAKKGEERNARSAYAADISFAEHALQEGELNRGRQRLEHYLDRASAERGFEWRYLWRRYRRDLAAFNGHEGNVQLVAVSPDGRTFATAGRDKKLILWDAVTRLPRVLNGNAAPILSIAFSPDGKLLATGSEDKTIKLWDVASRAEARTLPHAAAVYAVAFAPVGTLLAAGDASGGVTLWDTAASAAAPRTFKAHDDEVDAVAFSRDGRLLATGGADKMAYVWDAATLARRGAALQDDRVYSVAFATTKGETRLFTATPRVYVSDALATGEPGPGKVQDIGGAALDISGNSIAVGDTDGDKEDDTLAVVSGGETRLTRLGDIQSHVLKPPAGPAEALAEPADIVLEPVNGSDFTAADFVPGRPALVTAHADGAARLWDIRLEEKRASESMVSSKSVIGVAFAQGGGLAAYINADGAVGLLDTDGLSEVAALQGDGRQRIKPAFDFSPTEKILAVGGGKGKVSLWRVDGHSATPLPPLQADSPLDVKAVAFSQDGALLAAATEDGKVSVWGPSVGGERRLLRTFEQGPQTTVSALAFSADGSVLAVGDLEGIVKLWETKTWTEDEKKRYVDTDGSAIARLSFSGDRNNKRLLVVARGVARIWDTSQPPSERVSTTPRPGARALQEDWPSVVKLDADEVLTAVFSHDGRTIATGESGRVRLWDALARDKESGPKGPGYAVARRELTTIRKAAKARMKEFSIFGLAFSSDDRMLLGSDNVGRVWLWRGVTEDELTIQQGQHMTAAGP
jgi:WD40 repeat protein